MEASEKATLLGDDSSLNTTDLEVQSKHEYRIESSKNSLRNRILQFLLRSFLLLIALILLRQLIPLVVPAVTHFSKHHFVGHSCGGRPKDVTLSEKAPLEAHIMSKCPDAKDCLQDLILPAMQRVEDMVDFKLSYIGRSTSDDGGVECKHGPGECLGNIIELCAASVYPEVKTYLGFTMCLTKDYQDIPDRSLVEDCSLEHGLNFTKLDNCVSSDDGYGIGLLRDSVTRSSDAGVQTSCTIRLDNKVWCVRDGGEWKNCENGSSPDDLVRDIEQLYFRK